jgi:hypothetical protein
VIESDGDRAAHDQKRDAVRDYALGYCVTRSHSSVQDAFVYVLRWLHTLPKQGSRAPWRLYQNYARDVLKLRRGPLEDEGIEFSNPRAPAEPAEPLAA